MMTNVNFKENVTEEIKMAINSFGTNQLRRDKAKECRELASCIDKLVKTHLSFYGVNSVIAKEDMDFYQKIINKLSESFTAIQDYKRESLELNDVRSFKLWVDTSERLIKIIGKLNNVIKRSEKTKNVNYDTYIVTDLIRNEEEFILNCITINKLKHSSSYEIVDYKIFNDKKVNEVIKQFLLSDSFLLKNRMVINDSTGIGKAVEDKLNEYNKRKHKKGEDTFNVKSIKIYKNVLDEAISNLVKDYKNGVIVTHDYSLSPIDNIKRKTNGSFEVDINNQDERSFINCLLNFYVYKITHK